MFTHLHVHSDFSLLDGVSRIPEIVAAAKKLGFTAIALTDHNTLQGAVPFFTAAREHGIKPILGVEMDVADDRLNQSSMTTGHLTFWAENQEGYGNLMKLVSDASLNGKSKQGVPRTDLAILPTFAKGLIVSTGCQRGVVCSSLAGGDLARAREYAEALVRIFGRDNVVVEAQHFGDQQSKALLPRLAGLARALGLKLVATNNVHFVDPEGADLRDTLACVAKGERKDAPFRNRATIEHREAFLKTERQMREMFGLFPYALNTSGLIADRCNVEIEFGKNLFPRFPLPDGQSAGDALRGQSNAELSKLFGGNVPAAYRERLDYELGIIAQTGFSDYYLVVADIVSAARQRDIPVGPGRGSGGGSLVAYAMGITRIDPIRHGLYFERFLNPERVSPPDFDIDFCDKRRGEVFEYIRQKYGRSHTAMISAMGTFGTRGAARSLGKVFDLPEGDIEAITRWLPEGSSLSEAYNSTPELRQIISSSDRNRRFYSAAVHLESNVRQGGRHAAGAIISPQPIAELVPLAEQGGEVVVQLDKNDVEKVGLLKLDILGVSTVSITHAAARSVREEYPNFSLEKLPLNDEKTFSMLREGRTAGVFQLSSQGMTNTLAKLQVDSMEDLMAAIALYRPGPMQFIDQYAAGKADPKNAKPPHPLLAEVTKETHGILVYQEQVMEAARCIGGFSLGQADLLRKAMSKKDARLMQDVQSRFVQSAMQHRKIDEKTAQEVFAVIAKFADYGFNKSHSAGYGALVYQCAYLKAHHPSHYMAASLTSKMDKPDELSKLLAETRSLGVKLLTPDINKSPLGFTPDNGAVRFGLGAIRGLGDAAAKKIIAERSAGGPFRGVTDLMTRVDNKECNQRVVESLIRAGCFDSIAPDRVALLEKYAKVTHTPAPPSKDPLVWERELLGQPVSANPLDRYGKILDAISSHTANSLSRAPNRTNAVVIGTVSGVQKRVGAGGKAWATATIETRDGNLPVTLFHDAFTRCGQYFQEGEVVVVRGNLEQNERFGARLQAQKALDLPQAVSARIRKVRVDLDDSQAADDLRARCEKYAAAMPGSARIVLMKDGLAVAGFNVKAKLGAFEALLGARGHRGIEFECESRELPMPASTTAALERVDSIKAKQPPEAATPTPA